MPLGMAINLLSIKRKKKQFFEHDYSVGPFNPFAAKEDYSRPYAYAKKEIAAAKGLIEPTCLEVSFSQRLQEKDHSLVCVFKCRLRWTFCVNSLPQSAHLNSRSLV